MYKHLRKIIEKFTGYPQDSELAKEYMWAWRLTKVRPTCVEWSETVKKAGFRFDGSNMTYFCYANFDGSYYIGNVDTDGFFNEDRYKRKAYLIEKHLKIPINCSKEESVVFCAKAVRIERDYRNELIDTSGVSLRMCQHSIINFG